MSLLLVLGQIPYNIAYKHHGLYAPPTICPGFAVLFFFRNLHSYSLSDAINRLSLMNVPHPIFFLKQASTQAHQPQKLLVIISKLLESMPTIATALAQNTRNVE